jgi:hypothetical protein
VSAATVRRLELASGGLAADCQAAMERRLDWFVRLPAEQRAGVLLVTQTGVANFVAWLTRPGEAIRLTADAFRIAPRDLARRLSLRQTVDLVRIATEVFEEHLPPLAGRRRRAARARRRACCGSGARSPSPPPPSTRRPPRRAAPGTPAGGAGRRRRGARRGRRRDGVAGLGAGVRPGRTAAGRRGLPRPDRPEDRVGELRRHASRTGRAVLVGVQGSRLVVLVSGPVPPAGPADLGRLVEGFGPARWSSARSSSGWPARTPAPGRRSRPARGTRAPGRPAAGRRRRAAARARADR